jgi:hypothetical protein
MALYEEVISKADVGSLLIADSIGMRLAKIQLFAVCLPLNVNCLVVSTISCSQQLFLSAV